MIIYDGDALDKAAEAHSDSDAKEDPALDPPPTYSPTQPAAPPPAAPSGPPPPAAPPAPRPCNFAAIVRRQDPIRGTYTVDPSLCVPRALLPPEGARENLRLESVHGCVDVEVVLAGARARGGGKTALGIRSTHGRVAVRLHAPAAPRDAFRLAAHSTHQSVTLYLPRAYAGLLTTTAAHGAASVSPQLGARMTTFSDIDSTRVCFVGDVSGWKDGAEGWAGDEVALTTRHGRLRVAYIDEAEPAKGRSLLSRVLGLTVGN